MANRNHKHRTGGPVCWERCVEVVEVLVENELGEAEPGVGREVVCDRGWYPAVLGVGREERSGNQTMAAERGKEAEATTSRGQARHGCARRSSSDLYTGFARNFSTIRVDKASHLLIVIVFPRNQVLSTCSPPYKDTPSSLPSCSKPRSGNTHSIISVNSPGIGPSAIPPQHVLILFRLQDGVYSARKWSYMWYAALNELCI